MENALKSDLLVYQFIIFIIDLLWVLSSLSRDY